MQLTAYFLRSLPLATQRKWNILIDICLDSNPWLRIKQDVLSEDVPETEGYEAPQGMNLNEQSQYAVVTDFHVVHLY